MSVLQAVLLAIIEGLTEFLPVSSTGHMIIASSVMGIQQNEFVKVFTVAIQFGCILSVLVLYAQRFCRSYTFYLKLLIAFIPAAILGKLFSDQIDQLLESPLTVAITLIAGGIVFLFVDKWFAANDSTQNVVNGEEASSIKNKDKTETANAIQEPNYLSAFIIGVFQCIAMIPGISRSGATIIGALTQKLNRQSAAEFSFFLAVPTMLAATVYKLYGYQKLHPFESSEIQLLVIGNIVAFAVGILAIRFFIGVLKKYGFKWFGWYRILAGVTILLLLWAGVKIHIPS